MIEMAISEALSLLNRMNKAGNLKKKQLLLFQDRYVNQIKKKQPELLAFFSTLSIEDQVLLLIPIALRQGKSLFNGFDSSIEKLRKISELIEQLRELEKFYQEMGGIIGYHLSFLRFVQEKTLVKDIFIQEPFKWDLTCDRKRAEAWAWDGIKNLDKTAAIFPMGGAGDRLGLIDPLTNEPLPAACLPFMGIWLIEHLIREVEALEIAYYRNFGEKILIPIAIMTSDVKQNHERIFRFLEEKHWFYRPKESFFLFQQMSVPLITVEGDWGISSPLTLDVRPGGHGVLWKLMEEKGVFEWLMKDHQKSCAFLRQINNPVGGLDLGYLPLLGIGSQGKKMGFASCPRKVQSPEGMNVFCRLQKGNIYEQGITNIEYTDFEKYQIQDKKTESNFFSVYPANTNILFVQLDAIREALQKDPYPGLTINLKNSTHAFDLSGALVEKKAGRLEVMMQNIADALADPTTTPFTSCDQQQALSTFLTFNHRQKTLSGTKKLHFSLEPIEGTPQGALFDFLVNCRELLSSFCHIDLPQEKNEEEFLQSGPSFLFSYHPALGPLFSDMAKKIQSGRLALGAEVNLNVKDIIWNNVSVEGSLLIASEEECSWASLATTEASSFSFAKVVMKNVSICNKGIDYEADNLFWKGTITRKEKVEIHLKKNSQLILENITLTGDLFIEVPANTTFYATMKGNKLVLEKKL